MLFGLLSHRDHRNNVRFRFKNFLLLILQHGLFILSQRPFIITQHDVDVAERRVLIYCGRDELIDQLVSVLLSISVRLNALVFLVTVSKNLVDEALELLVRAEEDSDWDVYHSVFLDFINPVLN